MAEKRRTKLAGGLEAEFQSWYQDYSKRNMLDPNPDDPRHKYDYRGWFKAILNDPEKYAPVVSPHDGFEHGPSEFKDPDHPTMWKEIFMRRTGEDPDDIGIGNEGEGEAYIQRFRR